MAYPVRAARILLIASLAAAIFSGGIRTASPQVLINEIVTDPKLDWDDSGGGDGVAFNDRPGTTSLATEDDQWVELLNNTGVSADLTSWTLEMIDTTSATEALGLGGAVLRFTSGSTLAQLLPGGRLVVGNPVEAMDNACYLVLRNAVGAVVDAVELGMRDYAGDGVANNASSGTAFNVAYEAVARVPDGRMSGDPSLDFRHIVATIGSLNPSVIQRVNVRINEIVTDPHQDWNDSDGGDGVLFNDRPGSGTMTEDDQWIELVNLSPFAVSLERWVLIMHDTAPASETLGTGGAQFFFELGGSLNRILAHEHVVVGNPAGVMDHAVWIRLLDTTGSLIDEVELGNQDFRGNGPGDEAPDGGASSAGYEAVMRIPDGFDTDNDAVDFRKQPATIGRTNVLTPAAFWHLYP